MEDFQGGVAVFGVHRGHRTTPSRAGRSAGPYRRLPGGPRYSVFCPWSACQSAPAVTRGRVVDRENAVLAPRMPTV